MSPPDNEANGRRHGKFLVMDSAQMTVTSALSVLTEQSLPECDVNSCNGDSSVQNTITKDKNSVYFYTRHDQGGSQIGGIVNGNGKSVTVDTSMHDNMQQERRSMLREPTPNSEHLDVNFQERQKNWKKKGDAAFIAMISALYGKILVVMGLALPMSEVISSHVTSTSYVGFYLYLYFGSILYLAYVFISLVREKAGIKESTYPPPTPNSKRSLLWLHRRSKDGPSCKDVEMAEMPLTPTETPPPGVPMSFTRIRHRTMSQELRDSRTHHGSFYLRIGAVAFGVGSMIYSGLEFAQYFEIDVESHCHDVFMAVAPAARMVFTFIQMYFIFLNSKMAVYRHRIVAHFGLMHMIATNLCIWLNIIIEETKHEILFGHHSDVVQNSPIAAHTIALTTDVTTTSHAVANITEAIWNFDAEFLANYTQSASLTHPEAESLHGQCRRSDVMGTLVQDASPFLFPCAIEYSLICAAILYVMWKNTVSGEDSGESAGDGSSMSRRSRHHYSIDCARANKGLFSGIFVFVMTIISLIVFFALINRENYKHLAIMEVNISRLVLYIMTFVTIIIGIFQHRELKFDALRSIDLDDILLLFGQTGVISYNMFTIIAARYKMDEQQDTTIELVTALVAVLQALLQTLFILDASRRSVSSHGDQIKRKPGREVVTFLLVANFAMWTVNTLEKSRADVNPVQLQFYGLWPWIIIANVSMPLAIFYRFHSTVCLCEIWKRCYKAKRDYM